MIRSTVRLILRLVLAGALLFAVGGAREATARPRCYRVGFGPIVCVNIGPNAARCDAVHARGLVTVQCPIR